MKHCISCLIYYLTHDSGQKFEISCESAFLWRRPRCVFCDVVYKKDGFLDSKNGVFTQSKNLHDMVKNSKFLLSLLFFEKGLDVYFYDVVYKKEGFLECKNVILTESKNLHFSKGLTHDFGQKLEISFKSVSLWKMPRYVFFMMYIIKKAF